jgi:peptide/nickel transport system substrate-binding protein
MNVKLSGHLGTSVCLLTALLLTIVGCSSSPTSGAGSGSNGKNYSGTISIGYYEPPDSLSPTIGVGNDAIITDLIYGLLVDTNSQGNLEPGIATRWAWSGADNDTFTVWLRHGVKFSDGTPLNAAAVVFDWKQFISAGDIQGYLEYVIPNSIHAVNAYEVQEQTSQPNSQLAYAMTQRPGMIMDPTAYSRKGANGYATSPVGAGPYKLTSVEAGQSYCLTRNTTYWNNAADARIQNMCFQFYSTLTAELVALRSGAIQVAQQVDAADYKALKSDAALKLMYGIGTLGQTVFFNGLTRPSSHGPNFTSKQLAIAFNVAINREQMNKVGSAGLGVPSTELVPPGSPAYDASYDSQLEYNPAEGRELMKGLGYSPAHPDRITCDVYPGLGWNLTGPVLIADEAAIGIQLNLVAGPVTDATAYNAGDEYPCYAVITGVGVFPGTAYENLLWSKGTQNAHYCTSLTSCGPGTNWGDDQYINQFFTTFSEKALVPLYDAIDKNNTVDPGVAVCYYFPAIIASAKDVGGLTINQLQDYILDDHLYYAN